MTRPDFTDPYEAARVSSFVEPASYGRWSINRFSVDDLEHRVKTVEAIVEGGARGELMHKRTVPPGDYLCLRRKTAPGEDTLSEEVPIMSDTPSEIGEHSWMIDNAEGRTLIVGLGLGCIVSALLAKPEVEHITVVEIDRDVIALTGPYYEDESRVTIVNTDALRFAETFSNGRLDPFDYAWFDIWSSIADRNLSDETAEHGISYGMMFDAYRPFCKEMGAWAYPEAQEMRRINIEEEVRLAEWCQRVIDGTEGERAELIEDFLIRKQGIGLDPNEPIPDDVRTFFNENLGISRRASELAADAGFLEHIARAASLIDKPDPMPRPNEVEEANVAR